MLHLIRAYGRLLVCALAFAYQAAALAAPPAVALYYGAAAPLDELKAFDIVVVDADHGLRPAAFQAPGSSLYAYAALTEVHPSRAYFQRIPAAWRLGRNSDWDSVLVDQSQPDWPAFFAEQVIAPLWEQGFRGFFIDTLDSYRLASQFNEQAQQDGVVAVIEQLHRRFPGIQLILNRGFEVLPRIKDKVQMVAAESLYQGWNARSKQYAPVSAPDRDWLLQQAHTVRSMGIPMLIIDYVPPQDRAKTRETAQRIKEQGFIPWVTDHQLHTVGIGSVELVPRRIAVLYNGDESPALNYSAAHRFLQMPLNYLGYIADYYDVRKPLPEGIYGDRYAAVASWFDGAIPGPAQPAMQRWIYQTMQARLPWAVLGDLGFDMTPAWAKQLGLQRKAPSSGLVKVTQQDAMVGFETRSFPADRSPYQEMLPPAQPGSKPLVTVQDSKGQSYTAGAITPWGGFLYNPYVVQGVPGTEDSRWVVDPFAFVQQALRLQVLPVPDVTTENGRRLLFAHIDGDGFPSKAEMPGNRFAADWLLTDILQKYRIPHAVSVIESEVSPQGLYPQFSAQLEGIAKRMFALPHVEVASHTYSHPYLWDTSVRHGLFAENKEAAINLSIPGYTMDLHREIVGSVNYIRDRLAQGKPVRILLWSGDTAPGEEALKITTQNGLLNMNGGDTYITRSNPSLTAVQGHGITKQGYLQVYAPVTNENIYTELWHGPFYGYERVIETFEMTETPRRLKAVDIYYHTYSASKLASINALHKAYGWAARQPLHPVFPSEYIRKVQDFYGAALAREGDGWRIRTQGELRTVRIPKAWGPIDMQTSTGVAGSNDFQQDRFVNLVNGAAFLRTSQAAKPAPIALQEANARLQSWQPQAQGVAFRLEGHAPLEFSLAVSGSCQLRSEGRVLVPQSHTTNAGTTIQRFRLPATAASFHAQCAS
ncbi:bifunctional glycoside hydrolase 114/ polysaccharide deacetylase family protein [Comamonas sp. GB3 AK4-5]|uniref:bifunctional glycoside hydrolase 114/ polysaccharide deacetylase family protein n=1 Tax=Comamonas sp. GB3 AK4-5 TaxID=3231487 RepID=UPI00351E9624